jgi:hypothetical protein
MPALTLNDLTNAKVDVDHIADVANSEEMTAIDRLGNEKKTLNGMLTDIQTQLDDALDEADGQIGAQVAAAEAAREAIDNHIYPGTYATAPITRPDASPIQNGDMYVSATNGLYARVGGAWVIQTAASTVDLANNSDNTKGAALVGYVGESVGSVVKRAIPYRVSTEIDLLIVYGQSNALGLADSTPGTPTYKEPLARAWNGSALVALTSAALPSANGTSSGSAWLAFANEYCKRTGRRLVIVNGGKSSMSVTDLQQGTTEYTNLAAYVTNAKAAIVSEGNTVGKIAVAWVQGERDTQLSTTPVSYNTLLGDLWTDMKADFGATFMGIFTVGYYLNTNMKWGQVIQQAQRLFARANSDVFIAYDKLGTFGSTNGLKVDVVHYNQYGYNIMGREGAARFAAVLFPDNGARATDEQLARYGRLSMQQSQAWNLHAAVLQKSSTEPGWNVSHTEPRSHSLITAVDSATSDYQMDVQLACPATTVMSVNAEFGGLLKANNVRAIVGDIAGVTLTEWAVADVDGLTTVPITFVADISLRLNLATGAHSIEFMGTALASLDDAISIVIDSTGQATITHPTVHAYPSANIVGSTARQIRVNPSTSGSTIIQLRDGAGTLVNDTVTVQLSNMRLRHIDLPVLTELSLQIIAADYALW